MQRNVGFYLTVIILAAIFAALFVYPNDFLGKKFRPWKLGLDLVGGSHLVYQIDLSNVKTEDKDSVVNGLRDVIERRVNLFGVSEPQVYIAKAGGGTHLVVELAGVRDISEAIRQIGETPFLDFRETMGEGTSTVFVPTELNGRYVTGARLAFEDVSLKPYVGISFNSEGAGLFEEITGRNVGKILGIFLDNTLIEAPVVETKISGGEARITGNFTVESARRLTERFNAGALPAPITLINQQTVNPSLGVDSLNKAVIAGAIGTALIILFMLAYYRRLGIFATAALLIYIALTLGVFKLISITLTLAGLAGFILTIGMAVDANILIFERVKEELRKGLQRSAAIGEGFKRAWPSIRDSNTSTIITAIILYFFTSSFIKGFALTLLIGVLMSMFSAITTTGLLLRVFLKDRTPVNLNLKPKN